MIAMEINLTITMICKWKQELCTTETFRNIFLIITGNAKLRPSFVICWGAQGSRPRCGPRHPILHSNIFFYVKLFATIILSWNSLKFILWYLLELADSFIKGRLNTDTSPQNFWTTFLANNLMENFNKSAVASAIAIPLPLCFSCFVPLRRSRENLTIPFYLYPSRTWLSRR